ncbi:MAG: alginate lyase family protein [Nitrospira sp.]|nr:alginate lyase family protein [Nitrospira sp.]
MRSTTPQNLRTTRRSLVWYAQRLRVMEPAEVFHRVAEHCTLKVLATRHRFGWLLSHRMREDVTQFSFCSSFARKLPGFPWSLEIDDATVEALLSGKLFVLGHEWVWRPHCSVWHEAPDTHRQWPHEFFGRIPYREGNPYGDVRVAWEPSRLQHLVALGLLAQRAAPDIRRRAVAQLEAQFLSWVGANPSYTGIHFISVMECGLRILAVCHALDLVREWLQDPEHVWPALLELVRSHVELIRKRISIYSSAGNHTIAEAAALVYAGSLFPEMPESQLWRSLGLSLLEQEAPHQILSDGGGSEQTFCYQRFVSDLYGLVVTLLQHQQCSVPSAIEQAFYRSKSFLNAFRRKDGSLPFIGDGDSGHALSPFLNFSDRPKTWSPGLTTFDASGYSVIRSRSSQQHQLIFDHGPLGLAPCYAHGHADALSVIFQVGELDVLLDAGTYTYTGDRAWRNYFRGTRAHNTIVIDHKDQAVQENAFMWSQPFYAHVVINEESSDGAVTVLARHDGYEKRTGVTHWRAVLYSPPHSWLIWDRLAGSGVHHLELNWHLGIEPNVQADLYVFPCMDESLYLAVEGGASNLYRGETTPICGWQSCHYGIKKPIPTLRTVYAGSLPHEFSTRIWIGTGEETAEPILGRLAELRRLIDATQTR